MSTAKFKLLSCPQCNSKNTYVCISADGGRNEISTWAVTCEDCKYSLDYLGRLGTKASAIADWNKEIGEYHILSHLQESACLSFNDGHDSDSFLESTNFTEKQLALMLGKLAKEYKVDKSALKAYGSETLPDGKKYSSYSINEHGLTHLKTLKRLLALKN